MGRRRLALYCRGCTRTYQGYLLRAPLGGKLGEIEPLVVRRFGGIQPLDVARIDVHRVDSGFTIIKSECCVVAGWWLVRRACRVGIGFKGTVRAFVVASDEPPNTGCLGWLVIEVGVDGLP